MYSFILQILQNNDTTIVISDIYAAKKRKLSDIDILLAQQF